MYRVVFILEQSYHLYYTERDYLARVVPAHVTVKSDELLHSFSPNPDSTHFIDQEFEF
jgi:hypothetical protein